MAYMRGNQKCMRQLYTIYRSHIALLEPIWWQTSLYVFSSFIWATHCARSGGILVSTMVLLNSKPLFLLIRLHFSFFLVNFFYSILFLVMNLIIIDANIAFKHLLCRDLVAHVSFTYYITYLAQIMGTLRNVCMNWSRSPSSIAFIFEELAFAFVLTWE